VHLSLLLALIVVVVVVEVVAIALRSLTAVVLSVGGSSPYTSTDSCHSVAVVLTPVQTVVTRWQ
jgi:hypothetical protein